MGVGVSARRVVSAGPGLESPGLGSQPGEEGPGRALGGLGGARSGWGRGWWWAGPGLRRPALQKPRYGSASPQPPTRAKASSCSGARRKLPPCRPRPGAWRTTPSTISRRSGGLRRGWCRGAAAGAQSGEGLGRLARALLVRSAGPPRSPWPWKAAAPPAPVQTTAGPRVVSRGEGSHQAGVTDTGSRIEGLVSLSFSWGPLCPAGDLAWVASRLPAPLLPSPVSQLQPAGLWPS